MTSVLFLLAIPKVEDTVTLEGTTKDESLKSALKATIDQLIWFAQAIKLQKEKHGLRCVDCFDDTNLGYKGLPYKNKKWVW